MSSIRDFIPLSKLGEGTFSTVYKVRRISDQKVYALKKVRMNNLTQK
jgi:NIMA (never in mitosis gene a)-related kinase